MVPVKNANSVTEDVVLSCGVVVLPNSLEEVLSVAVALSRPLLEHLHCLVVTLGASGVLLCGEHDAGSVNLQPRKQKRVRPTYIQADCDDDDNSESEDGYCAVCLQRRKLCAVHYPALTVTAEETMNVSGAGDRC